jgi:hypothetical protein
METQVMTDDDLIVAKSQQITGHHESPVSNDVQNRRVQKISADEARPSSPASASNTGSKPILRTDPAVGYSGSRSINSGTEVHSVHFQAREAEVDSDSVPTNVEDFGKNINHGQISWPTFQHQPSPQNTVNYSHHSSPRTISPGSYFPPNIVVSSPSSTYHPIYLANPDAAAAASQYPPAAYYPAAVHYPGAPRYSAGPAPPLLAPTYPLRSPQQQQPPWTRISR